MEDEEYCDICGGPCEGVHSLPKSTEQEIQLLVDILRSQNQSILKEALRRLKL